MVDNEAMGWNDRSLWFEDNYMGWKSGGVTMACSICELPTASTVKGDIEDVTTKRV